ncbi:hypothetical protein AN932_23715 [Mycobacterium intracellulare subsp. chimaera]|nr:hypothetical protein AN932_23715 [Mycobacterium intracellulare subsp. chimaera]
MARGPSSLAIPTAPAEIRADTAPIEDALSVIRQVDELALQLLENSGPGGVRYPVSIDNARSLIRAAQQQAADLADQLDNLTTKQRDPLRTEAANEYARRAGEAYSGFLQRILEATDRLVPLGGPDSDVVAVISHMLDEHPWIDRRR